MTNPAFLLDTLAMYPPLNFDRAQLLFPDGLVYVLHFETPLAGHAAHYVGWVKHDLDERLRTHASGNGSCLMAAVGDAGISWRLAVVFPGSRKLEREIKNYKNTRAFCPICRAAHRKHKVDINRVWRIHKKGSTTHV